jgi:hypothetical protein
VLGAGGMMVIWLQMSTIGEGATRRCEKLADASGVGFVDAPVLGTREPAEQGDLVILESGPEEVFSVVLTPENAKRSSRAEAWRPLIRGAPRNCENRPRGDATSAVERAGHR